MRNGSWSIARDRPWSMPAVPRGSPNRTPDRGPSRAGVSIAAAWAPAVRGKGLEGDQTPMEPDRISEPGDQQAHPGQRVIFDRHDAVPLAVVGVEEVDRRVRRRLPVQDALRHRTLPLTHVLTLFDLELEQPVALVEQDEDSGGVVNRLVEPVSGRGQDAPGRSDLEAIDVQEEDVLRPYRRPVPPEPFRELEFVGRARGRLHQGQRRFELVSNVVGVP